ncbi:inositol monophosphatase family protein [Curtobacterium flaccumfaciens]
MAAAPPCATASSDSTTLPGRSPAPSSAPSLDGHRPWPGLGAFLDALADRSCTLRVQGSGTLTIAQVAAGRGIGGCVSAFNPVDHGAAVLLVHEAGGVVLTPAGPVEGFPPVGEPFLVAHPGAADELHAVWTAALAAG